LVLASELTDHSLAEIGDVLGGREQCDDRAATE
jgi:chromosomal replication initiation ATPase DnaA